MLQLLNKTFISIINNNIYTTCRRSHMVITNSGSTQEDPYPLRFTKHVHQDSQTLE
jgi:hypothetical protein